MKKTYNSFFGLLLLLLTQIAVAQEIKVTGKVTDEAGFPVPGANVIVKGTKTSTSTNFDGFFELKANKGQAIEVSFIGFESVEVLASEKMTVVLKGAINELDAVQVVGYGTQIKRKGIDNISGVKSKDIQQIPVATVQNALVGKLAGVQITQTNGKVEGGISVRVRGSASISAGSQPLYVLDGMPLVTTNESSNGSPMNPLLTLSPNEIESIDVLKDASSAAIYGARGANGVVLITTKKGKEGKPTFSVNFSQGVSEPTNAKKFLNAAQYVELLTEASINSPFVGAEDELIKEFDYLAQGTDWKNGEVDTDWNKEIFQTGYTTDADFSASGGDEKSKYFLSTAYNNTTGIITGNDLNRLNVRTNVSSKVTNWFKTGVNMSYSLSHINRIDNDNALTTPMQGVAQSPLSQPRLADGSANPETLYASFILEGDNSFYKTMVQRINGKVFGEFKIVDPLKFNSELSYDHFSQTEDQWRGSKTPFMSTNGSVFASAVTNKSYVFSNFLTYDQSFDDKHSINAVVGMEFTKSDRRYQDATGIYLPNDYFQTIDGAAQILNGAGEESSYTFVSQFGRVNYSFDNKYLFKASMRRDGSSRFGKNERFGIFPAFSAGWIASEESFLKDNKTISFLKLKGSWGQLGNAEIGNFASRQLFAQNSYNLKSGLTLVQPGNDDLTWEKSTQTDLGFEIGFFDRFSFEADYYSKITNDLLFAVPLAPNSGASRYNDNIGDIKSSGYEMVINTKNYNTDNFKWETNFNLTTNQTKVGSLPNNNADIVDAFIINRKGENVSSFYLKEYAGVDPANGDALYYKNTVNADGSLDRTTTNDYGEAQRVVSGNPFPELMMGMTNTLNYKNFDFSFTFQGEWGASIYNSAGTYQSTAGAYWDNQTLDQMNRWQKPGDITNVPQARLFSNNGTSDSTRYLEEADFIRLRNLNFGYSLPKSVLNETGLGKVRFYLSGVNLLTFTKYNGSDPEARRDDIDAANPQIGQEFYSAPPAKTIALGVNINF
jgi:TonB-linked SusC/RagA family outer membrane protein